MAGAWLGTASGTVGAVVVVGARLGAVSGAVAAVGAMLGDVRLQASMPNRVAGPTFWTAA